MAQTLLEEVNTPAHYRTHESGIEAIEITRHLPNDLGNAWKYGMRYEDKGTPKKDLLKLCWYINDYRENLIDINNCVTEPFKISGEVVFLMERVIESEPVDALVRLFRQIEYICIHQGVVNPAELDDVLQGVKNYAETFNG